MSTLGHSYEILDFTQVERIQKALDAALKKVAGKPHAEIAVKVKFATTIMSSAFTLVADPDYFEMLSSLLSTLKQHSLLNGIGQDHRLPGYVSKLVAVFITHIKDKQIQKAIEQKDTPGVACVKSQRKALAAACGQSLAVPTAKFDKPLGAEAFMAIANMLVLNTDFAAVVAQVCLSPPPTYPPAPRPPPPKTPPNPAIPTRDR